MICQTDVSVSLLRFGARAPINYKIGSRGCCLPQCDSAQRLSNDSVTSRS
jgi:hypothetical protein